MGHLQKGEDVMDDGFIEMRKPRGRKARREARENGPQKPAVWPGIEGGQYAPLSSHEVERIHETVLDVLENIGMAGAIPILVEHALEKGCKINEKGRMCFPRGLVEDVIAAAPKKTMNYGQVPDYDQELGGDKVYFNPGGEAVTMLDHHTDTYRPSTLLDVYDFARLTDRLEHINSFSQIVVPTDVPDLLSYDLSSAYAAAAGTQKHVGMGLTSGDHVAPLYEMVCMIAGGEDKYKKQPFMSTGGCPVVSPLTYGEDNAEVCVEAPLLGTPVSVVIAPQAGATSPAALAGTLVQSTAETMAALLLVNLVHPGHPVVFGSWPFVSDLRTGAFSGGGGEQAVLAAAAVQVAKFYGLPCGTGAGMSDSKLPDCQMGFEKGITTLLAAMSGANYVSEVSGMMASLMGGSFEAMVIDNEMLGMIQRVLRGIEVTEETLSYHVIEEVVDGPGHYLGHGQTLELMESEYLYPGIADRTPPGVWQDNGGHDIRYAAREKVTEILSTHYPEYIEPAIDEKIRERFPIALPREAMNAKSGRW